MQNENLTANYLAQEGVPKEPGLIERIRMRLFPVRRHVYDEVLGANECIITNVGVTLGWKDRLRTLASGRLSLCVTVTCADESVRVLDTRTEFNVMPPKSWRIR